MSGLARPSPRAFTWIAMLVAWWSAVAPGSPAQERADDDPFLPGLVAVFRDARGNTATRVDHQLSFLWGEGPPDPRLVGGEFHATWQGRLLVEDRGEYRFFVFGTGEVELKVAGKVVLPRQALRDEWRESAPVMLAAE
ncbi:MAG TPA: PA14 domain-containing protein, partial [Gemmataceae bacterium]|nr:PA14 domain-containing protein [Gemmataceae bacterium]